jgi:hypothetical protein
VRLGRLRSAARSSNPGMARHAIMTEHVFYHEHVFGVKNHVHFVDVLRRVTPWYTEPDASSPIT